MLYDSKRASSSFPAGTMTIFETVFWSNHVFIQPQIVGKKAGAPITYRIPISTTVQYLNLYQFRFAIWGRREGSCGGQPSLTHISPPQRLRIMRRSKRTRSLHMRFQSPKLQQANTRNIDNAIRRRDRRRFVRPPWDRGAQRHHEANKTVVSAE